MTSINLEAEGSNSNRVQTWIAASDEISFLDPNTLFIFHSFSIKSNKNSKTVISVENIPESGATMPQIKTYKFIIFYLKSEKQKQNENN